MTLENCKLLLEHYKNIMDNPLLSEQARLNARLAHKDMVHNLAVRGVKQEVEKPKK